MGILNAKENFTFFIIAMTAIIGITVVFLALYQKSGFEGLNKDIPYPPRLFASALSYLSGNPVENMDVTLKSSCGETFDYIKKYIDIIPLDWGVAAIKYAVQLSGTVGSEVSDILDQLNQKKTKAMVLYACDKLKGIVCK